MQKNILNLFENIEEVPLFYVESGSRLWGIASSDSDFDVRGFHLQSKNQYFDFRKHRDVIEVMDGDFDFVSYDLDKMFGLLLKSNPSVFEWVRADIIYYNNFPNWENFKEELMKKYDFKSLFHHYLSMAKGNFNLLKTNKKFTYKIVFYCIRGLLSAHLSAQHRIPELLIDRLFIQNDLKKELLELAKNYLEEKKQKTEKEEIPDRDKNYILSTLQNEFSVLEKMEVQSSGNYSQLEKLLQEYSFELKNIYY